MRIASTQSVLFPILGCRNPGLIAVTVTTFGARGTGTLVHVGPKAQAKAAAIERIIHCTRFHGPAKGTPDAQLEVQLELAFDPLRQGFDGDSYSLAVALADMRVAGLLPRLDGATVIATGVVGNDDEIGAVARLDEKLALIASALATGRLRTPVQVIVPSANQWDDGDGAIRRRIDGLRALGVEVHALARLSDACPRVAPPRAMRRRRWLVAAALVLTPAALLAYLYPRGGPPCPRLPDSPMLAERCWGLLPLTFAIECRYPEGSGYTPWTDCPVDLALADGDKFRFKALARSDGHLYAWEIDTGRRRLTELLADSSRRRVAAGEAVLLPKPGGSFELDRATRATRFVAILANGPVDLFERSGDGELFAVGVPGLLNAVAQPIRVRRAGGD